MEIPEGWIVVHDMDDMARKYTCAECGGVITTADDLVTVNVDGHAKAAHRTCPSPNTPKET